MPKAKYQIDLIKQMAVCDANYILLLKLLPQLEVYLDQSFESLTSSAQGKYAAHDNRVVLNGDEPEKLLEGISREFCIADLEDSRQKVTVEITIVEAFKYTTTLEIVQKPEFKEWMTNPSMIVRVYHDANTAEVISYQGHRNLEPRYTQPNPKMYHADEKMQVNGFLGEWLSHCLKVGRSTAAPELIESTS